MTQKPFTRRAFLLAAPALCLSPKLALAQELEAPASPPSETETSVRNISSFSQQNWRDHFDSLAVATIVADTTSRALHYWNEDGSDYRVYPTSVPMSEELTKPGYTKIVRKRIGPDWTPTQNMLERDPTLKYMPPGPDNPLGTHAMYLEWPAYLIHGTHDTRKIGRRSSSGCIGLYNQMIETLYDICPIGTQVRII